jgi:threonine/homoserine/homoserine lactone efflux protein
MDFLSYLSMGAILGLSAGISPGPLLALVISETLRHGRKEGIRVAFSPLITDLPIILLSLLVLNGIGHLETALGILWMAGGIFILYLGYECLKTKQLVPDLENPAPNSLKKGILVNILNPHPYLFWITVGAPIVFKASRVNLWTVAVFFISFYLLLVGSKILVAILVDRSKTFLNNKGYIWVMRALGIVLFVFAVFFLIEGIKIISGS